MRDSPEVQRYYQVTGPSDMVMFVCTGSMEEYGNFARQWFERSEDVGVQGTGAHPAIQGYSRAW